MVRELESERKYKRPKKGAIGVSGDWVLVSSVHRANDMHCKLDLAALRQTGLTFLEVFELQCKMNA